MKQQWTLISALVFALIIAIFSVVNVEAVPVDYVFGSAQFPLIMVILGSALAGGFVVGLFGTIRMMRQNRQIRLLQRELQQTKETPEQETPEQETLTAEPATQETPTETSDAPSDAQATETEPFETEKTAQKPEGTS